MSLAKLELARFPTYLDGECVLRILGCDVYRDTRVAFGGVPFARLLDDGSLDGTVMGEDGPGVRVAQGIVPIRINQCYERLADKYPYLAKKPEKN